MGKMDNKQLLGISIVALIFSPFILAGRLVKSIGQTLGLIKPDSYEYDPTKDPNYVAPSIKVDAPVVETKPSPSSSGNNSQGSTTPKPQIGQGFDNPNRLDPNS